MSHQLTDLDAIETALASVPPRATLLLVRRPTRRSPLTALAKQLLSRAQDADVPIRFASGNDMRRMTPEGPPGEILALVDRAPTAGSLAELMARPGAVWLLAGITYPSNAGFLIRTVEVAGATGVVLDSPFSRAEKLRALRISMGAHRFLPVLWRTPAETVLAARQGGRRIIAVEHTGTRAPWEEDLTGSPLLVVGGERHGIPPDILDGADAVIRLPVPGFVPVYNVHATAAAVALERLRQHGANGETSTSR